MLTLTKNLYGHVLTPLLSNRICTVLCKWVAQVKNSNVGRFVWTHVNRVLKMKIGFLRVFTKKPILLHW